MRFPNSARLLAAAALLAPAALPAQAPAAAPTLAQQVLEQLINLNTTDAHGTTAAAQAMRQRLLDAGFAPADVVLVGANPNKQNMVARLHGTGARPPLLLLGHLDVVEARRQDWSTDPFHLVIKDGVYFGRGVQDMKSGDAIFVALMASLKRENYRPDRDIILALTAAEEGGSDNGVQWLLAHRPGLIQAAYVLNADGGGVVTENGKPAYMTVDASEKLYADFQLSLTNPGGHSSLPRPVNAIDRLAQALIRLQNHHFPVEINAVTRGFFEQRAKLDAKLDPARAADERAIAANPNDSAAAGRLEKDILLNATLHTTCVPTRLAAGDANNALPQNAEALVNCRIMPGHSARDIQRQLVSIVADPDVAVRYEDSDGRLQPQAPTAVSNPPAELTPELFAALRHIAAAMWGGIPVVPDMATGASDGKYTNAQGMPTYAVSGLALDVHGDRAHGRDEDLPVESFLRGAQFYDRLVRALTGGKS